MRTLYRQALSLQECSVREMLLQMKGCSSPMFQSRYARIYKMAACTLKNIVLKEPSSIHRNLRLVMENRLFVLQYVFGANSQNSVKRKSDRKQIL